MRRLLLALLALVALLVVCASWWASRSADVATGARAGLAPDGAAAPTAQIAEAADATAADATAAAAHAATLRSAPTRRETRRIRVVDARTSAPLPAASAWWMTVDATYRWLESDHVERGLDVEAAWRTHGHLLALDENAEAELPRELVDTLRVAALGELGGNDTGYDERFFPSERTDVLELRLARQQHVDAFVVDAQGRPAAGVPVGLADLGWSDAETLIVRTDAAGRARIRGVTRWLEKVRQPAMLGIVAPLDPVPFVRALPEQPVTLQLPPCGALRVHARVDTSAGDVDPDARPSLAATLRKDTATGVLPVGLRVVDWDGVLGPLQAGEPLVLDAELAHWQARKLQLEPLAPGETRDVEIVFGAPEPVLVARVLGPDNEPRASELFELRLTRRGGVDARAKLQPVATDARGRLSLTSRELVGDDARVIVLSTQDGKLAASTPIPHPLAGYRELGDLVLQPAPLVAAGIVVDALGAPLEGAELTVHGAGARAQNFAPTYVRASSGADGRFELRGELAVEPAAIRVELAGRQRLFGRDDGVRHGATNLVLALHECSRVSGRIELPANLPLGSIAVQITPDAGGPSFPVFVQRNGAFDAAGIPAGLARLEVLGGPCRELLAVLDALVLPPNGQADDPRLNPLRLTRTPELIRIRVVDAERRPLTGNIRALDGESVFGTAWTCAFFRGELVLPRICGTSRYAVSAARCAEQTIDVASAPAEIVLAPALRVELDVLAPGLPDDAILFVELARAGSLNASAIALPGEIAKVDVSAAGRWTLSCTLRIASGAISLEEAVPCEPASIEVGPDQPVRRVLRFDGADAQAVLAAYRR